ncbi:universal stress protein [Actinomycetospora sp. TBRC 11914]|uniref:universal stress protein n=1 Tax=Actinomycetospora sp. TBRC 11914 TaxID=2729387 RepID=UPI00145F0F0E|nr:universal stress protein [Actinomycetospora sp. TBRC 11914]NMO88230.1 universal stress protein [Actinomycetospora sp. TBRC 11914]
MTEHLPTVVCGIDDSVGGRAALEEAIRRAGRRGARIRAVLVYEPPEMSGAWGWGPTGAVPLPRLEVYQQSERRVARKIVEPVLEAVRPELPTMPPVEIDAVPGWPVEALVEAAEGAQELVVGHRGRGAVSSVLMGSTSLGCVLHAPCPVTVVPARDRPPTTESVIVVGVDGSPGAEEALRWALAEAGRRGAALRAVVAVRPPESYSFEDVVQPDPAEGRRLATAEVRRRIEELREQTGSTAEAEAIAITGSSVPTLVEAAVDAELLVVGHRGRGPWRSALLGSVALGVVLHAPCPVTVVPPPVPTPATAHAAEESATALPIGPIA